MRRIIQGLIAVSVVGLPVVAGEPALAAPTSVTLTTSATSPQPEASVTLTATANATVTGGDLTIQIWDTTKDAFVVQCDSGTTCAATVGLPSTMPRTHTYQAYLAPESTPSDFPPPPGTVATSGSVTVTWQRKWRAINPSTKPAGRYGAHMAYHPGAGVTVLFGGCKKLTPQVLWVQLEDGTEITEDRGGLCLPGDALGDTWVFDASSETWSPVTVSGASPHPRFFGSMTYDYTSGRVVLFGGVYQANDGSAPASGTNCLQQGPTDYEVPGIVQVRENDASGAQVTWSCFDDTWTLRKAGSSWTWEQLATAGAPSARFDAAMAFDAQGRPTLVGGCEAQGYLGSHGEFDQPREWDCSAYPEVEAEFPPQPCVPGQITDNPYLTHDPAKELCIEREAEHTDSWRLTWTADPAAGGTPVWAQVGCLEEDVTEDELCAPPELRGAAMTLDPGTGKLVLTGGYYYEPRRYYRGFLGDTWEFDGDRWEKVVDAGAQDKWCPSHLANKAWMGTAPVVMGGSWQVLNFGGYGAYFSNVIACPDNTGHSRQDPWNEGTSRPTENRSWADTWRWDRDAPNHDECGVSGDTTMCWFPVDDGAPSRREAPAMAYDPVQGKAVLFGGKCASCAPEGAAQAGTDDTWVFDATGGADPCAGCGGAYSAPGGGEAWERFTVPLLGSQPAAVWGPAMAEDPVRGETVLFGGCTGNNNTCTGTNNQTLVWVGDSWVRPSLDVVPSARFGAQMAWDDVDKVVVMFGGATAAGTALSDTWVWNGTTWTQKTPAAAPSGRVWHGMATDATGRPVLFGGCIGGGLSCSASAQTWRWDGTTWTTPCGTATCPGSPSGRLVADQMAADASGKVLLFGGYTGSSWLSDTWSWDGTAWNNVSAGTAPPPRSSGAMATVDFAGTELVLLFGGASGTGYRDDTWLFTYNAAGTGGTWARVECGCVEPGARQAGAMAYSPADGRTVLFGGLLPDGKTASRETWEF